MNKTDIDIAKAKAKALIATLAEVRDEAAHVIDVIERAGGVGLLTSGQRAGSALELEAAVRSLKAALKSHAIASQDHADALVGALKKDRKP